MNIKLLYKLWRERGRMSPSAGFKRQLLAKIRVNAGEKQPSRVAIFMTNFRWGAAIASVLSVALLVTGAYAYNSSEVTEGTVLYPVKQKLEKMEELTKHTPEAKADFYLKQIKRREAEELALERKRVKIEEAKSRLEKLETNIAKAEEQAERVQSQLEEVNKILTSANDAKSKELRQRVQAMLEEKKMKRERELDEKVERIRQKAETIDKLYASLEEEMEKQD